MEFLSKKTWLLIALLWVAISSSAYDFEVDGIYYTVTSTGNLTCEVSGKSDEAGTSLTIPEEVSYMNKKLSVTSIGERAFDSSNIEYVTIPLTIKTLKEGCFINSSLKRIGSLSSITYFGTFCFRNCEYLDSITFGASDETIRVGRECFYGCSSLTKLLIPSNVIFDNSNGMFAEDGYFEDCKGLKELTIDCQDLPQESFMGCSALTEVIIGDNCKTLGSYCFQKCISLNQIKIPSTLEGIGSGCFSGCTSLKSIVIPESIVFEEEHEGRTSGKYYGESIFEGCTSLEEVEWNANVIPLFAFDGCTNLTKLTIGPNTSAIYLGIILTKESGIDLMYSFDNCNIKFLKVDESDNPLRLLYYFKRYTNGTGEWTDELSKDQGYYFQNGLLQIFHNVEELYTARIIDGLKNYKGDEVDYINLKKLIIGSTSYSFGGSVVLKNLEYLESECLTPPYLPFFGFSNSQYMTMEVFVPLESLELYKNAEVWRDFWNLKGVSEIKVITENTNQTIVGRYDLSGKPVNENFKGFVIVRFSDGSTKKIMQ